MVYHFDRKEKPKNFLHARRNAGLCASLPRAFSGLAVGLVPPGDAGIRGKVLVGGGSLKPLEDTRG